jgi:tetratricopeptide (TPR) repeat protein
MQSSTDLAVALEVANELERRGSYDLARRQLDAVIAMETGAAADSLRLRRCATWHRQGQLEPARACYEKARLATDEARALARYRGASLAYDCAEDAKAAMLEVLERWPATDAARRALRFLRGAERSRGGPEGEAGFLLDIASRLRDQALASGAPPDLLSLYLEVLIGAGRIQLEELDRAAGAVRILASAARAAAESAWLDDALFFWARALGAAGQRAAALDTYQRLIDLHETSWFAGSYTSPFRDDALLERADLLAAAGRLEQARAAYLTLIEEAPDSRLVDDAAFRAARIAARSGDPQALRAFITAYPESRHVRSARQLLAEEAP